MAANAQLRVQCNVSLNSTSGPKASNDQGSIDIARFYDGATAPDIDSVYPERRALVAGALTLDLTALVRAGQSNLDWTGKVVYGYVIRNNGANAMTFTEAAANGYNAFPLTPGLSVGAGDVVVMTRTAGYETVGAAAKDITVAGTGTQTFDILMWAGTP